MDELLYELIQLTDEEQLILQSDKKVLKDMYTSQRNFIIESEKFLSKDKMIMVRKHTRFVDFPMHKHNYIEINYVYNGTLKQKVGKEEITLKKGELLFLNQHIEHEIDACTKDDIIINFIIQPQFFEFILSYLNSENLVSEFLISSLYNHTHNGHFLYFQVSEIEEIQELIKKMIVEIMSPSLLSDSSIKLYMGLLMVQLIKNASKAVNNKDQSLQHYIIVESLKYIDENYKQASLYELAKKLKQPHYSLSKQIKKATSYTFKELLQEKRLSKAKELFDSTKLPIVTVVEEVGYDNISYFYRIFKKKYQMTPKEYRKLE
ncbi:MAG: AraC family transcriptional regulator [Anaerobacillus sp.]|uniref:AraC family transcriptional regulator n=1 Tax=Anaerobacillus sp. TaxID=1872506 RepID=UPI00391928E8